MHKLLLALSATMIGAGLVTFALAVHVHVPGEAPPSDQICSASLVQSATPARVEIATASAPRSLRPLSARESDAGIRLGFLEFEDELDAPSRMTTVTATTLWR